MGILKIKKIIFTFCLIISTNIYASVVSDNDGSTFITKAEFDSLANNFQFQINNYNLSIDSRIDEAISSYLSGIKIAKVERTRSGITELNKNAKEVYKWWTDVIDVSGSRKPIHGFFGGLITMTLGACYQDWTGDKKTTGSVLLRYTVMNASDPEKNNNYFKWYSANDREDALYYESESDTLGTYLTGNNYGVKYYKGYEGSQMTNSVTVLNKSEVFSTTDYKASKYKLWFHLADNIAQMSSIGTDNSWNSDTFDLPWQIFGVPAGSTSKIGTHKPGLFQYHSEDIETQAITKNIKVLLINNYQRDIGPNDYYMSGMPLGASYNDTGVYSVDSGDWNIAQIDTSTGKEYTADVVEQPRIYTAYYDPSTAKIVSFANGDGTIDATYGETQKFVWKFHPYSNLSTSALIDKDSSFAYGSALKPYEGAWVASANKEGVMRLKLRFHARDASMQGVKYAIRKGKFSASTKLIPNVTQTSKSVGTWTATTETPIDIRFDVEKNEEYFIQVEPVTPGQMIGIEQIEDIEISDEDSWTM